MNKKIIILALFMIFILSGCSKARNEILINDTKIEIIGIADNSEKSYLGLSFRESMCDNCGMFFPFKEKIERVFVMRDMKFPLDIVWIDNNEIIKIHKNLKPEGHDFKMRYKSNQAVNNVLELNAGFTDKHNIKPGDKIIIEFNDYVSNK